MQLVERSLLCLSVSFCLPSASEALAESFPIRTEPPHRPAEWSQPRPFTLWQRAPRFIGGTRSI